MRRLCARIGADNVIWLGVVRADEVGPEDPTGGWRAVTSTLTGLTVCNTASGAMALGIPGFRRARVSRR